MDEDASTGKPIPLWHNHDYLLLWSGQAVSSLGTGISQFAFPLLVLALTHSFAVAGIAGALQQLPYLLFSLPAGALVDRWNRKRVMIISTLGLALCLTSIPVALVGGYLTSIQLYVVSFVIGTLFVFYQLAELAALTQLVPKAELSTAVAQNEVVYSAVQLLAPSLGGLLVSMGYIFPFVADGISYLVLLGTLLRIRSSFRKERQVEVRSLLLEVWEGIHWLWSHTVVCSLAFLTGYLYVLMSGGVLIVYAIARQYHISLVIFGIILGVGGGGNIVGTALSPLIQRRVRFGWALAGTLMLFLVLWPLYSLIDTPVLLGAVVASLALVDSISSILIASYRLAATPDELQGRVGGVYRLILYSFLAVGQVGIGQCLDRFGVGITVGMLWCGLILFAFFILVNPHMRRAAFPQ